MQNKSLQITRCIYATDCENYYYDNKLERIHFIAFHFAQARRIVNYIKLGIKYHSFTFDLVDNIRNDGLKGQYSLVIS